MNLRLLLLLPFLNAILALDTDNDGIDDASDKCPFDRDNDADSDNMCSAEFCRDDPKFLISLNGFKCSHFGPGKKGYGKCKRYHNDGIADVCSSCSCTCAQEIACGFDPCPADAQNDADKDGICGDVDVCPLDKDNDADSDGICGNIDTCNADKENDADSDNICGDIDSCPYDSENDADSDLLCGNEDKCPFDALNDVDSDDLCGDVDSCPTDQENDADSDNMCDIAQCVDSTGFMSSAGYSCAEYAKDKGFCKHDSRPTKDVCTACSCACAGEPACGGGSVDVCPHDPDNDADNDNLCGDVDSCPFDKENDADSDNLCADKDVCPNDASNDVDSDNICGQVDSCPMDPGNDADGDKLCDMAQCVDVQSFVSAKGYTCAEYATEKGYCKHDSTAELDVCTSCACACADEPACAGSFDMCPNDPNNDADSDNLCADEDVCPNDAENDFDQDMLCADVDPCPHDFRAPVDGRCSEERLRFSQLDSLQTLRETFPAAALTDDCPWSGAQNAAKFGLDSIQCVRSVQVFRLHTAKKTLSGSLAITADIKWSREHQEQLAQYIASVARVRPTKISFSRSDTSIPDYKGKKIPGYKGKKIHDDSDRRSLSHLHSVNIIVSIKVDHLPFRPLRCSDPKACNFNEDITTLFISSNKTATDDCCSYSCESTIQSVSKSIESTSTTKLAQPIVQSTSQSAADPSLKSTRKAARRTTPNIIGTLQYNVGAEAGDDELTSDCQLHYLYMGIGIGVGACLVLVLILIGFTYCVLKCMGYRLQKKEIIKEESNSDADSTTTEIMHTEV